MINLSFLGKGLRLIHKLTYALRKDWHLELKILLLPRLTFNRAVKLRLRWIVINTLWFWGLSSPRQFFCKKWGKPIDVATKFVCSEKVGHFSKMAFGDAGRPIEVFFDNWKTMVPLNHACKRPIRIATRLVITICWFVYLKISNNGGNKGNHM